MRERYLDGLRGWAAVMVLLHHLGPCFLWGTRKVAGLYLPFSDGALGVYIFFVISGFVLTIGVVRTGQRRVVADLAIRRYPRLAIPILVSSIFAVALMSAGAMANSQAGSLALSPWLSSFYGFEPSLLDAVKRALVGIFLDPKAGIYNDVLWTMYFEMLGSVILFGALLISGAWRSARVVAYAAFLGLSYWFQSPVFAIALGAVLAEVSVTRWHAHLEASRYGQAFAWTLLCGAIVFAATRDDPNARVQNALCGGALLYSVMLSRAARKFLSSASSQWLGKISFSLYLTHLLVICSIGSAFYIGIRSTDLPNGVAATITYLALVGASLGVACLFRPVDDAAVRFSRWVARAFGLSRSPAKTQVVGAVGKGL